MLLIRYVNINRVYCNSLFNTVNRYVIKEENGYTTHKMYKKIKYYYVVDFNASRVK